MRMADSTALPLMAGREPGSPRHTGQTFVFGSASEFVEQLQNILLAVDNSTCTSSPRTGSKRSIASS